MKATVKIKFGKDGKPIGIKFKKDGNYYLYAFNSYKVYGRYVYKDLSKFLKKISDLCNE